MESTEENEISVVNKKSLAENQLSETDPGDEMQRRVRYQHYYNYPFNK